MSWEYYFLYFVTFIFGYLTCRIFYFFKTTRLSLMLLRVSHVVSLTILAKCIEEYAYATYTKLKALNKTGVLPNDPIYKKVKAKSEKKVEDFKQTSIATLLAVHPKQFLEITKFKDWPSAMDYLQENREVATLFLMEAEPNDR